MNNSKTTVLVAAIAALVLLGAYQQGRLDADSEIKPAKIGVVNMTRVFEDSAKNKKWRDQMQTEQVEARNQLNQMNTELEAIRANLKLRTPGSEDFMKLREDMFEKEALLKARETLNREKVNFQMQKLAEEFHEQLIEVSTDIAKSKGLDIIITDELADLAQMTKSKVLLYHNLQYDLTDEVLAAMDAEK